MFSKILLATDLSQASERVVYALSGLKKTGTTEVVLLYCLNIRDAGTLAQRLERGRFVPDVMGTQGRGFFGRLLMGCVAYHVARKRPFPQCSGLPFG
jgi:hypothetical protein